MLAFLSFFMASTLAVTVLVNETAVECAYNFEIYDLLTMPVPLGSPAYVIVRHRSFHLRAFGAQVLAIAIIALIASDFAFVTPYIKGSAANALDGDLGPLSGSVRDKI